MKTEIDGCSDIGSTFRPKNIFGMTGLLIPKSWECRHSCFRSTFLVWAGGGYLGHRFVNRAGLAVYSKTLVG